MASNTSPAFPTYLLPSPSFLGQPHPGSSFKRHSTFSQSGRRRPDSTVSFAVSPSSLSDYLDNEDEIESLASPVLNDVSWSSATSPRTPGEGSYFSPEAPPAPSTSSARVQVNRNSISSLTSSLATTHLSRVNSNASAISSAYTSYHKSPAVERDSEPVRLSKTGPDTLKCQTCSTDFAYTTQVVSKGFTGRHGRAFLLAPPPTVHTHEFTTSRSHSVYPTAPILKSRPSMQKSATHFDSAPDLINIRTGRVQQRQLVTGMHVVADISCIVCGTVVGWKYVDARERGQRYKIGKFILECKRVVRGNAWEDSPLHARSGPSLPALGSVRPATRRSSSGLQEDVDIGGSDLLSSSLESEISMLHGSPVVKRKDLSRHLGPGSHRGIREGEVAQGRLNEDPQEDDTVRGRAFADNEVLVFDSEDESECEDLFAGVWDAEKVRVKRAKKAKLRSGK